MVRIPTEDMDTHTIIIAQSGSGKSFFLGRLVEEIMLKSRSRCLILDPNGDFRNIHKIRSTLWNSVSGKDPESGIYDIKKGTGFLTREKKESEFGEIWKQVISDFVIKTNRVPREIGEELRIWWPSISLEFLLDPNDYRTRIEMFHCHNWAKQLFNQFSQSPNEKNREDIVSIVKNVFKFLQKMPQEEREKLKKGLKIDAENMINKLILESYDESQQDTFLGKLKELLNRIKSTPLIPLGLPNLDTESVEKAKFVFESYSWDTVNSYFGLIEQYQSLGILAKQPPKSQNDKRLEVIDLPSINNNELRALVINSILTEEWEHAKNKWEKAVKSIDQDKDYRVPTYIILDEAHNFIPLNPRSRHEEIVREQFRTIAAEGRKFGLFLILVSQRADKLDDLVLSECGNKAIMRLDSPSIVSQVIKTLGLEGEIVDPTLNNIKGFKKGILLLVGKWVKEPTILYGAARRTLEGGKNLNEKYWARPMFNSK